MVLRRSIPPNRIDVRSMRRFYPLARGAGKRAAALSRFLVADNFSSVSDAKILIAGAGAIGSVVGAVLHAATVSLATPSVIRLSRYVRVPYRNRVPLTRAALMRRDNYKCAYCGRRAETIDHVVPRSRGGQHAWENCVASCTICNHRKADRLLEELGWTLAVPPAVPRGAHWRLVGAQHDGDPQWAAYLREPSAA